jgi:N-acetylglucosaminyl-diphospho-decaprenol L-rhamnosyltransferase
MSCDLSVIVVTHGGRDMALTTLRSARAAAAGLDVEWFVVDSGSRDDTPDAIERAFPDVRLFRRPNIGFAAANNVALAHACGRYVLLLNPDVEIAEGTFADLVATMDARPRVGLCSVVQRGTDGDLQPSIRRFPSPARDLGEALFAARWPVLRELQEPELRPQRYTVAGPVDWVVGAFLWARRDAIAEVGGLDEQFFLYSEEIDWCWRFWAAGWRVEHLPVMTIIHHAGRRWRGDLMAQLSHSRMLFASKHFGRGRRLGIRLALALGHVLRLAVFAPVALARPAGRARIRAERAGLVVLLGLSGPPMRSEGEVAS